MTIKKHENLIELEPHSTLWRYLSYDKFESLLETKSLFFCRADKFSDPFEGSIPREEVLYRPEGERLIQRRLNQPIDEREVQNSIKTQEDFHKNYRRYITINCWHINTNESDAMWRLYLKDNEGVAIQTSTERMNEVIDKIPENIFLSKIRYIDYEKEGFFNSETYPHLSKNIYVPFIHKRKEFTHESEFRLLHEIDDDRNDNYWENQPNPKGIFIRINVEALIEKIYFHPTVNPEIEEKIKKLVKEKGFNFEFCKSRLSEEPSF